jgi:hypothetical protein
MWGTFSTYTFLRARENVPHMKRVLRSFPTWQELRACQYPKHSEPFRCIIAAKGGRPCNETVFCNETHF